MHIDARCYVTRNLVDENLFGMCFISFKKQCANFGFSNFLTIFVFISLLKVIGVCDMD